MSHPTSLTLENVRCFAGPETGQIRRITLLVGENGAGKSTFLGCFRTFARLSSFADLDDFNYFNDPPFKMGSFATISRHGCQECTVEGGFLDHCHDHLRLVYRDTAKRWPAEHSLSIRAAGNEESFRIERVPSYPETWRIEGPDFRFDMDSRDASYRQFTTWLSRAVRMGYIPYFGQLEELRRREAGAAESRQIAFAGMSNFLRALDMPPNTVPCIVAPDPSLPERHRAYRSSPLPEFGRDLAERVADLGRKTGLFSNAKLTAPRLDGVMEMLVETPDGWRNLVDVGYGIHSVLPLLADICRYGEDATFLLQQPEVSLHPAAQADLATVMASSNQSFLIETHSDHLVDRFRICAMRGDMEPEDLQILYFEKAADGKSSRIHSIAVDANGNLSGAPRGYRKFFLEETHRLLFARRGES